MNEFRGAIAYHEEIGKPTLLRAYTNGWRVLLYIRSPACRPRRKRVLEMRSSTECTRLCVFVQLSDLIRSTCWVTSATRNDEYAPSERRPPVSFHHAVKAGLVCNASRRWPTAVYGGGFVPYVHAYLSVT